MKKIKDIVPESERQAYWKNLANYKRIILRKKSFTVLLAMGWFIMFAGMATLVTLLISSAVDTLTQTGVVNIPLLLIVVGSASYFSINTYKVTDSLLQLYRFENSDYYKPAMDTLIILGMQVILIPLFIALCSYVFTYSILTGLFIALKLHVVALIFGTFPLIFYTYTD